MHFCIFPMKINSMIPIINIDAAINFNIVKKFFVKKSKLPSGARTSTLTLIDSKDKNEIIDKEIPITIMKEKIIIRIIFIVLLIIPFY